jgi:hypothetical protein
MDILLGLYEMNKRNQEKNETDVSSHFNVQSGGAVDRVAFAVSTGKGLAKDEGYNMKYAEGYHGEDGESATTTTLSAAGSITSADDNNQDRVNFAAVIVRVLDGAEFDVSSEGKMESVVGFDGSNTQVVAAAKKRHLIDENYVLCDTESTVHVFRNKDLLSNLRRAESPIYIEGVCGGISVNQVGDYGVIKDVYYHKDVLANILCFDILAEIFEVIFKNRQFRVRISDEIVLFFNPHGRLYMCNGWDLFPEKGGLATTLIETVAENEALYTKRELKEALQAKKFMRTMVMPSVKSVLERLRSGSILNCPVLPEHVLRAVEIWGPDLMALKGRTVKKKVDPIAIQKKIKEFAGDIVMCVDIFFIASIPFLLSVSRKLNLLMVNYLERRNAGSIRTAIFKMIGHYAKEGFKVKQILSDGEGGVVAIKNELEAQGIAVNLTAQNEHVPEIERAGRQLKERVRGVVNTLPYRFTKFMMIMLVYFCVQAINMFPKTSAMSTKLSPREMFSGRKIDYAKECKLEFGAYVQASEDLIVTNTNAPRTVGALALGPIGNEQGGYNFMSLMSWKVLKRNAWTELPIPQEAIDRINAQADGERNGLVDARWRMFYGDFPEELEEDGEIPAVEAQFIDDHVVQDDQQADMVDNNVQDNFIQDEGIEPQAEGLAIDEDEATVIDEFPDGFEYNIMDDDDGAHEFDVPQDVIYDEVPIPQPNVQEELLNDLEAGHAKNRYDLRPNRRSWRDRFATTLINYSVKKGINKFGVDGAVAVLNELNQLAVKGVLSGVKRKTFPNWYADQRRKTIRTLCFMKRKKNGTIKARVVADGSMQVRSPENDVSSPTVSTEALFATLAIDAFEGRKVATVDVEGAYLHCDMKTEVYVELEPQLACFLVEIHPEFDEFVEENGKLYAKLDKALYGCIESAKLFYEHISKTLIDYGYVANPYDICVFNKMIDGTQITVTVHVDDLKISCVETKHIDDLVEELVRVYKKVTRHDGEIIDYLGMEFDYSIPGVVKVSMNGMIEEALDDWGITDTAITPAKSKLFLSNDKSPKLEEKDRERFHSMVAKMLYIAKRGRPDIITAVAALTTRVDRATVEDMEKLVRVLKYLNGTKDLALYLSGKDGVITSCSIDTAFAVHPDFKSHSGLFITLGKGTVSAKSNKQKVLTKSTAEAELVGTSDGISHVIWFKNFMKMQGYDDGKPTIVYQDNKSTILMAEKGRSTSSRTRHMSIKYFFIKDRIESGEIALKYMSTEDMVADYFSKPLQGALFRKLRAIILNLPQVTVSDIRTAAVCWETKSSSSIDTSINNKYTESQHFHFTSCVEI